MSSSRVIGILSGKGGVGKTTLVANMGASLAREFNRNSLILDANVNTSHLGMHLGIYQDMEATLMHVLSRRAPISEAIFSHPSGVKIITAPLNGKQITLKPYQLQALARKVAEDHDFVLVDCPPGMNKEVSAAASSIDSALVVTNPDFPSVADALKTVMMLEKMNKKVLGVVVNRRRGKNYELTNEDIEDTIGEKVLATIPDDGNIPRSISMGMPIVISSPFSKASLAINNLAGILTGEKYEGPSILARIKGMLSKPDSYSFHEPSPPGIPKVPKN